VNNRYISVLIIGIVTTLMALMISCTGATTNSRSPLTWSGSGTLSGPTTETFTIEKGPWSIVYVNKPDTHEEEYSGRLLIFVYKADNNNIPIATAASTREDTKGVFYVHDIGEFYLDITGFDTHWEVTVTEPD